jgi:hypothetical protein
MEEAGRRTSGSPKSRLSLRTVRAWGWYVAAALVLVFVWTGIRGGIDQWPSSASLQQQIQTVAQFLYGVLSLAVLWTSFRPGRFTRGIGIGWAVALTIAGGLGPSAWGETAWPLDLVAGAATGCIAVVLLFLLRPGSRVTREPVVPST